MSLVNFRVALLCTIEAKHSDWFKIVRRLPMCFISDKHSYLYGEITSFINPDDALIKSYD